MSPLRPPPTDAKGPPKGPLARTMTTMLRGVTVPGAGGSGHERATTRQRLGRCAMSVNGSSERDLSTWEALMAVRKACAANRGRHDLTLSEARALLGVIEQVTTFQRSQDQVSRKVLGAGQMSERAVTTALGHLAEHGVTYRQSKGRNPSIVGLAQPGSPDFPVSEPQPGSEEPQPGTRTAPTGKSGLPTPVVPHISVAKGQQPGPIEETQRAQLQRYEHNEHPCPDCEGNSMVEDDKGVHPCPTCNAGSLHAEVAAP